MGEIGGNIFGVLQSKVLTKNIIGENEISWNDEIVILGFLDLLSGSSDYISYNSKTQESTHVFLCDYIKISFVPEQCRMIINNNIYDVLLIDNPMELNQHLEIYLKFTGGK